MSKKENFNKAVFDMFGVGVVQDVVEDAPQQETAAAEQGLSTDVQATEVATPAAAHAAPYSIVPSTFLALICISRNSLNISKMSYCNNIFFLFYKAFYINFTIVTTMGYHCFSFVAIFFFKLS